MDDIISISVFYEFAVLLVLAAMVGLAGLALRQPLIVSFIAVGILAGPSVLNVARSDEHIELFAELGVALLLFLVGLKLDLKLIRTLGPVALTTGLGQVIFTSVIGFLICLGLGLEPLVSLYVAVALTFSSTIIIVKLLSDKKEIDSLHGQIALGFLIVQDLVVVLAMVALSAFGIGAATDAPLLEIALTLASGVALLALVGLFIRYLAEPLMRRVARAPELMICFAIGWAALLAAVGDYLGLGKELGGLLAGVSLASTPFRESIATRMAPLRDFLVLFFFIGLGARLDMGLLDQALGAAILLSLFVLLGNPLIVLIIMGLMGYRRRTGFLAGLTVAQISEFSLIFMAMGLSIGHVDERALGLVTLVGLITIALSTYMITYSHRLYDWLEPLLGPFERKVPHREDRDAKVAKWRTFDVLLFGLGRYGTSIARRLRQHGLQRPRRRLQSRGDPHLERPGGGGDLRRRDGSRVHRQPAARRGAMGGPGRARAPDRADPRGSPPRLDPVAAPQRVHGPDRGLRAARHRHRAAARGRRRSRLPAVPGRRRSGGRADARAQSLDPHARRGRGQGGAGAGGMIARSSRRGRPGDRGRGSDPGVAPEGDAGQRAEQAAGDEDGDRSQHRAAPRCARPPP